MGAVEFHLPDIGEGLAQVELIRAAGLTPSVEEEETEVPGQAGRVIDQFPPPGSEGEPGDTVTITVGKLVVQSSEEEGLEE